MHKHWHYEYRETEWKNDRIREDNRSLPQILSFWTNGNKAYELATIVHAFKSQSLGDGRRKITTNLRTSFNLVKGSLQNNNT